MHKFLVRGIVHGHVEVVVVHRIIPVAEEGGNGRNPFHGLLLEHQLLPEQRNPVQVILPSVLQKKAQIRFAAAEIVGRLRFVLHAFLILAEQSLLGIFLDSLEPVAAFLGDLLQHQRVCPGIQISPCHSHQNNRKDCVR
ncbi:hypothetical protein D3C75_779210 [compost metagenome]